MTEGGARADEKKKKVLFVCTANICRSPMAEAMFNALAEDKGLPFRAESAGVMALVDEEIEDADENTLPEIMVKLMKDVDAPRGLRDLGYDEGELDQLVEGAMKQERLLVLSPREVTEDDLANILRESIENW